MQNKEILESLNELEKSLKDINSAREMVDKVVQENHQSQERLNDYLATIGKANEILAQFGITVKETKEQLLTDVCAESRSIASDIKLELTNFRKSLTETAEFIDQLKTHSTETVGSLESKFQNDISDFNKTLGSANTFFENLRKESDKSIAAIEVQYERQFVKNCQDVIAQIEAIKLDIEESGTKSLTQSKDAQKILVTQFNESCQSFLNEMEEVKIEFLSQTHRYSEDITRMTHSLNVIKNYSTILLIFNMIQFGLIVFLIFNSRV